MIGRLAVALLALASGTSPAAGVQRHVLIPGKFFSPQRELVLIGDTVTWQNQDSSSHTATARDGSFDSNYLQPGATFSRTFSTPGTYVYFCRIHRFMQGEVDVYGLALNAPDYDVPYGEQTSLKGLAPAATGQVTIRQESGGAFVDVGTADVGADGSFRYPLTASAPASYQAVAGRLSSKMVELRIGARVRLAVRTNGRAVSVAVRTEPAQPGAVVELQKYIFERFSFRTMRRVHLDSAGIAVLHLKVRRDLHLRALLPRGVAGFGRALSATVLVRPRAR